MSNEKNKQIKNSIKATRARHAKMVCKVYELKATRSKMSNAQKEEVNQYFREAKWLRNDIIRDVEHAVYGTYSVMVKVGDAFEARNLEILGSQVKQDIHDSVKSEIKGLHTKKEKGERVGKLKFKSYCNCIPLRQYGTTYRINFEKQTVKVQNIKKPFKVKGLDQIPADAEIANAKFIRKASGLYFHVTAYLPKEDVKPTGKKVGIDFGIKHNITTSEGKTYDVSVPESKGTKLASKRVNQAFERNGGKKSKNHYKRVKKLRVSYEHDMNKRKDATHKVCHELLAEHDLLAMQDEMLSNWHKGYFGKEVQHSAMGTIKAGLKNSPKTIVVPKEFPSTQICPVCGSLTKHPLSKRDYDCQVCGYHHDSRDEKAALSILMEAERLCGAQSVKSPTEAGSSVQVVPLCLHKTSPMNQEAQVL